MKKLPMRRFLSIAALIICLTPGFALAGLIGDPAPPLNVDQWIKGQPVEIKPGTNIFVVEIWGTTSATSRDAITDLADLQTRYQNNGVVVVAVSDEPAGRIKAFVDQAGSKINYRVAADNRRYTSLGYMNPVMQRNIPYVFVVNTNGILLWHGSPVRGLDEVLGLIISGKYDAEKAKKNDLAGHLLAQYINLARQGSDRTDEAGQTLLAARTNDVELLSEMAFQISSSPKLLKRDFALAGKALDQAEKLAPTNSVGVAVSRAIWLFESGKQDQGIARARQALAWADDSLQASNIQVVIKTMQDRRAAGTSNPNGAKPTAPAAPGQANAR
jgi:hypothetical protein